MSRKLREEAGMAWYGAWMERYGIKLDFSTAARSFSDLRDYFSPEVNRTDEQVLQPMWEKLVEMVQLVADGMSVEPDSLMRKAGIDPRNRSDGIRTRRFLKESGLLQYQSPQGEQWIRRINGPTNGSTSGNTPDAE
jgi:hypothetical protein